MEKFQWMSARGFLFLCLGAVGVSMGSAWILHCFAPKSQFFYLAANIFMGLFAALHASNTLGTKRAALFAGLTLPIAFSMEALSVKTQLATPYHYTDVLGPQLMGIPVVVPLSWLGMLYFSQCIASLILNGKLHLVQKKGVHLVGAALLTALIMTAWDLTMDPYLVRHAKAWIWENKGEYLGIPFANYISWLELTYIVSLTYFTIEKNFGPYPEPEPRTWLASLPVLLYAIIGLSAALVGTPVTTRILPPFTMGIAIMAALGRLLWKAEYCGDAQ